MGRPLDGGSGPHNEGHASDRGRVYQASGDQQITEHHYHYPVRRGGLRRVVRWRLPGVWRPALPFVVPVAFVLVIVLALKVWPTAQGSPADEGRGAAERPPGAAAASPDRSAGSPAPSEPSWSPSPPEPSPSLSPPADAQWFGEMKLTSVDLDADPPRIVADDDEANTTFKVGYQSGRDGAGVEIEGLQILWDRKNSVALWEDSATPTSQQCVDRIGQQGAKSLPLSEGSRFCVSSWDGRVGLVDVGAYDETLEAYKGTVIVWPPCRKHCSSLPHG